MASRPTDLAATHARDMPIYKRYYDLIANGSKTIEVRVAYTSMLQGRRTDPLHLWRRGHPHPGQARHPLQQL